VGHAGSGTMAGVDADRALVAPLLRRIRRTADLSQRELAAALGVARSTIARAETGARDLPATMLARAAELAGLRLGLLDTDGRAVAGMTPAAVRDRAGRLFSAHLDVRHGDEDWWHGSERYSRQRPWYTFDRDRRARDAVRARFGTPPDHQEPRPGDAPEERARIHREAVEAMRRARRQQQWLESLGRAPDPDPVCECPTDCDALLFPEAPLVARQNASPHVENCPCRCDIA
jgi:transcriptional regulator with XRE-family HTH domain